MCAVRLRCSVPQCTSKPKINPESSFYRFPRKDRQYVKILTSSGIKRLCRQEAWSRKLRITKPIFSYMRVCSQHFVESDFFHTSDNHVSNKLKQTAVPSQNLPMALQCQGEALEAAENLFELLNEQDSLHSFRHTAVAGKRTQHFKKYLLQEYVKQYNKNKN